ncbi:MAG: tRNA preQ1(34) S-adenosylmethionine ribosyltransferase-isomerase QueA [bacterium]
MTTSDFDYHLPKSSIAQEPTSPRDHARLMLINRQTQKISHHHIFDLPKLLPPNYFLVANNTKVFPARLLGHKPTGGKVEILLTTPLGNSRYRCLTKPGLKIGDQVSFSDPLSGIITNHGNIERIIKFNMEESVLHTTLSVLGTMPTPPYIKTFLRHPADYQTIYAKYGFSAAAPTAGLHFTPSLLKNLKSTHPWYELTLNVGLGTFLPVKEENVTSHHMHRESYIITASLADNIRKEKLKKNKLLAVGTTTMRALESNPKLIPGSHSTDIFIYPPYKFATVDALLTNFHLPHSTLLMLVSAFCSSPNTNEKFTNFQDSLLGHAYSEAIKENYRFFSFGDAMLIV